MNKLYPKDTSQKINHKSKSDDYQTINSHQQPDSNYFSQIPELKIPDNAKLCEIMQTTKFTNLFALIVGFLC